jgi:hypothetical protein
MEWVRRSFGTGAPFYRNLHVRAVEGSNQRKKQIPKSAKNTKIDVNDLHWF